MKMKSFLAGLGLVVILASCKKDKAEEDCSITKNNLAGVYKITAVKYKLSASAPEQDLFALMEACEKDDLLKLNNNGTYNYTDVGTFCSPSGTNSGTWSVNGNTLQSDGIITGTITSYNCKALVYFVDNEIVPGDKITFTMTKQ
jgi:hypothetical protein